MIKSEEEKEAERETQRETHTERGRGRDKAGGQRLYNRQTSFRQTETKTQADKNIYIISIHSNELCDRHRHVEALLEGE